MSDLVVLIPTLGRPHLIEKVADSIFDTVKDPTILFLTTPEDIEVKLAIKSLSLWQVDVPTRERGDYARKVNVGYRITSEPLIFLGATDLVFHKGWYEEATKHLSDSIHVVGTNDLGNPRVLLGEHSTHTLLTREYADKYGTADEKGKILHEGYLHEYVDDEFIETAKSRNAFYMAMKSKVEHFHPAWGKAKSDPSYAAVSERLYQGYRHYKRRRHLWTQQ